MTSRVVFQQEMDRLNEDATRMGDLAVQAIESAVDCVVERDVSKRPDVERIDAELYSLGQDIEKRCLDVIALHAPVAVDLRTISTCLKMITDLDRIGRYASDIVEVYEDLEQDDDLRRNIEISQMAELVVGMVSDAVKSFTTRDASNASGLFERDDEVDCLYKVNFRNVLTYMMEDPRKITTGTNWILVARYLERVADHSCNIGERVVYMVTGERMDAKKRKDESRSARCQEPISHSSHELEEK
ncbi:MAG: phosphate signaling complex protein PhoU [Methanomassiliicoccales archaeon]|nr:phosphate signaling complex protein PhoU [Methanomassiliicoccales archaeon]